MTENTEMIPGTEGINLPDPESMAEDHAERLTESVMEIAGVITCFGDLIDALGEFALANRPHFERACAFRHMIETIERRWKSGSANPNRDVGAARPGRRAKKDVTPASVASKPDATRPGHGTKKG